MGKDNYVTPEPKQFELPPRGTYHDVEFIGVENTGPSTLDPSKDRLYFTLRFANRDSNGNPYELRHYCNLVGGRKANLTQLLAGVLGRDPGGGYDLRKLIGKKCSVTITHTPPNGEGRVFAKVTDFFQPEPSSKGDGAKKVIAAVKGRQSAGKGTQAQQGHRHTQ